LAVHICSVDIAVSSPGHLVDMCVECVLIRDPGLAETRDPGSLASELDDSWRASGLARRASEAVSNLPHSLSLISSSSFYLAKLTISQVNLSI
jgi:hypothetical protein